MADRTAEYLYDQSKGVVVASLDEHLQGWSPEDLVDSDPLPTGPANALTAVLDTSDHPSNSGMLPVLWHWVYFLEWARHRELGQDGHPTEGHFLPPVPDRRRMFAGGRLTVHRPLELGRRAERTRSLANVSVKTGRSGEMAFVTVRSVFDQDGQTCLTEEHDYVYRSGESTAKRPDTARTEGRPTSDASWQQPFTGDPVRLFRYSALTANSHRIHYDAPYARDVESYPDLVVHGPLLVLLMVELTRRSSRQHVSTLDYRLRRPVFSGDPVLLTGTPDGNSANTAVLNGEGAVMVEAQLGLDG